MSAGPASSYRCSAAARWLPRVLAGAVLCAGLLAVWGLGADAGLPAAGTIRALLVAVSAIAAVWILRKGGELRLQVTAGAEDLEFEWRGQRVSLPFGEIDGIHYEAPFGPSRSWLPAAVLVDRKGREWRLSSLLPGGERLLAEIVARSGREALGVWVKEHHLVPRMARSALRVRVGYAVALVVVAVPALRYLL